MKILNFQCFQFVYCYVILPSFLICKAEIVKNNQIKFIDNDIIQYKEDTSFKSNNKDKTKIHNNDPTIFNSTNTNNTENDKSIWSDIGNNIHGGIQPLLIQSFYKLKSNKDQLNIMAKLFNEKNKVHSTIQNVTFYSIMFITLTILFIAIYFIYKSNKKSKQEENKGYELLYK